MLPRRTWGGLAVALLLSLLASAASASPAAATTQAEIINGYGRCLDAQAQTLKASVNKVQLWDCLAGAHLNQEWYIDAISGTSAYKIRSADTGRCLEARGSSNGAAVSVVNCTSGNNQKWEFKGDRIVNVAVPSRVLDAWLSKIFDNGTPVDLWAPNGEAQQNWFLSRESASVAATPSAVAVAPGQVASTTISWSAPGASARVWVSMDGGPRTVFATGARGSKVAIIPPGNSIFTVTYGTDPNEILATREVTTFPVAGSPAAAAGPCVVNPGVGSAMQLTAAISPHSASDPQSGTTKFGGRASVSGTLTNALGGGVAGAEVCLVTQDDASGSPMQFAGTAVTGAGGQYVLPIPPGPSRTAWVVSSGAQTVLEADVRVAVKPKITIHAQRKHLRNGQVLKLKGSVPGPIPAGGVLVEVQVWRGTYWQVFETTRTGPKGGYRAKYRFSFTTVSTKYKMRTRIPPQSSYPYLSNHSKPVFIHVKGGRAKRR